jgi:hypothetical protein
VKHGIKATINPAFREHSWEENKLAELIDWCHEHNPDDRPNIFQIVKFLDSSLTHMEK